MIYKCYSTRNNNISLSLILNDIGAAKVVHKLKALLCQCLTAWQHETLPWESNHKIGPKGELGNHDSTKYSAIVSQSDNCLRRTYHVFTK